MQRPAKASGKKLKTRRRKMTKVVRRGARSAAHIRSIADLQEQLDRRTRELNEALEQQTATSEVLKIISTSPGDLQPVFQAILANATHLCDAQIGNLHLCEEDAVRIVAMHGSPPQWTEYRRQHPVIRPGPNTGIGRLLRTKQSVHIEDIMADEPAFTERDEFRLAFAKLVGARTFLAVPMLKDDELIGLIVIYRLQVCPFTDTQIELVQNFAAQAVIAIENARLLNELRQRTDDLTESLEQQTATSEVLKVISSSPGELNPVFDVMLANATKLCEASYGTLWLHERDVFRAAARYGRLPAAANETWWTGTEFRPRSDVPLARCARTRQAVHVQDMRQEQSYRDGDPWMVSGIDSVGLRSLVVVPMLKDDELIGAIAIYRTEVSPFTDKQVELVSNFAAQAVIAIENTRLLNELRQRTADLTESLEQQTATSEVLKVISSSPGELKPVFQAMLENATRICEAVSGTLYLSEEDGFRPVAVNNASAEYAEARSGERLLRPPPDVPLGRMAITKQAYQIVDVRTTKSYIEGVPDFVAGVDRGGHRTALAVPLLKDDELVGGITLRRQEVRRFTDKQIELVQNFAAQAVIAIENARLLNELRQRTDDLSESLEQQTATSDVLSVISRSPGDLTPVFNTILENATRMCSSKFGTLVLREGDTFRNAAMSAGAPAAFAAYRQRDPVILSTANSALARLMKTKEVVHIEDAAADPGYAIHRDPGRVAIVELAGARTILFVPMLRENELVGAIIIYRQEVRGFSGKQIELLKNFAAQAVIAIENARLLTELRQRTDDLTESLEQQTATSEVLKVISSSPGDLEPVFQAILQNATDICQAKFANLILHKHGEFPMAAQYGAPPAYAELRRKNPNMRPDPDSSLARAARTKQAVQVEDVAASPVPSQMPLVTLGGARTLLAVPMLKDNEVVGVIGIYRQEVSPFTDKQIELVKNFAAQAVIAIENTRLLNELRARTDDLTESLEQQTATSEVLKVISNSPGELDPVFEAILKSATRICAAKFGILTLSEGDAQRLAVSYDVPPAFEEVMRRGPMRPGPSITLGRAIATKQPAHTVDITTEEPYMKGDPLAVAAAKLGGYRTVLAVPMLKDDELMGTVVIFREHAEAFDDKQISLVNSFAAQAVIAIENARLLNELRARTDDLTESLEQQTATSEVLKVISSSPGELQPVFQTMLENAVRICGAKFGTLYRCEGDAFLMTASHNAPAEFTETRRRNPLVRRSDTANTGLDRAAITKKPVQIADVREEPAYRADDRLKFITMTGARSLLAVPLLKDNELVGVIAIYRQEVRPFTDKQIELVSNFAAQAVIAIENTRLLSELRNSLERQTATGEILSSISGSITDAKPVFDTIARNLRRLFNTRLAAVIVRKGEILHLVAAGDQEEFDRLGKAYPQALDETSGAGRAIRSKRVVQFAPVEGNASAPAVTQRMARQLGFDAAIFAPMIRGDTVIGAIATARPGPAPFDDKQIALIRSFADQAVIAIENARLFDDLQKRTTELTESLEQQTATADVLKVISRSTFDLQAVFETLVESAARLCRAHKAVIYRLQHDTFQVVAAYGFEPDYLEHVRSLRLTIDRHSTVGRAALESRIVHIPDVLADPDHKFSNAAKLGGFRTVLGVPLMREGAPIGAIFLTRAMVDPFTQQQIDLVTTFADQAVIAIENVRLFDEIQDKSRQLAIASQHKSQFLANMSHELRTPLNAILGYTELILDDIYGETPSKMRGVLDRVQRNGKHLLGLINDVLDLSKIEAGQLTLSLTDYSINDVVHTVLTAVESLAAEKKIALRSELPPNLPSANGDERRITQVLLNLVGNAIKFTDDGEVVVNASSANGSFTVAVRDTGPGIAQADQRKIFEEFQQADSSSTKKKAGTGLGLAIAKRIVELHGGTIGVTSQLGQGSTFAITLPLVAEKQAGHP